MKKLLIFLLFLTSVPSIHAIERIGIRIKKQTVLSFVDDIHDVVLESVDYKAIMKGRNLIIRAKSPQAEEATLLVRYGRDKLAFVAEIFADDKATLHKKIPHQDRNENAENISPSSSKEKIEKNFKVFSINEKQQYASFGVDKGGIIVMVTNIAHRGKNTYLRIFVKNKTTVNLNVSQCTFEYITNLRKWIFFTNEQRTRANPLLAPLSFDVPPMSSADFDFSIPTRVSNGGLEIFFGELGQGDRKFKIFIPTKALLNAPIK